MNRIEAAHAAFGDNVIVEPANDRPGEYDVHTPWDPAIHLDDGDTYLGTVFLEGGVWMAVARLTPFVPSYTNEPPAEYDNVGDPYPIERKP